MERGGCVYIMTNKNRTVFYIGVTSDLQSRVIQHREKFYASSFTAKYNLFNCIYFEAFFSIEEAIAREKIIKKWRREKKMQLIYELNPKGRDLWEDIKEW